MPKGIQSATFTTEFGHEFEAERQAWLRRRFLWYTGFVVTIGLLGNGIGIVSKLIAGKLEGSDAASYIVGLSSTAMFGAAFCAVFFGFATRWPLLRISHRLVLVSGVLSLAIACFATLKFDQDLFRVQNGLKAGGPAAAAGEGELEGEDAGPKGTDTADAKEGAADERSRRSRERAVVTGARTGMFVVAGLWSVFVTHFLACAFLPWTPRESLAPVIPLLILNAVIVLGSVVYGMATGGHFALLLATGIGAIMLSLLVPVPGMGLAWYRHSRFRDSFASRKLWGRYGEMKRELTDARRIHESLFPRPCTSGPVRFNYMYEPMRQIGGDYLHTFFSPDGAPGRAGASPAWRTFNLVLIDVTGHGIPAALTVNRLHGELARVFAEDPGCGPGEVLRLLNRYVHLTLATHSVYVTALCLRIDPSRDVLEYASGGHPPAFLRAVDGTIEQLGSTAFVLGAAAGEDFRPDPATVRFGQGDVLIAYTDGATEARDARGRYLGIAGIQRIVAMQRPDLDGGWPRTIAREVERHRLGPTADDLLVVEVFRPLEVSAPGTKIVDAGATKAAGRVAAVRP